jgi:hypothetical protein
MPRVIWKPWVLNPMWHALLTWAFTLIFVTLLAGESPRSDFTGLVAVYILMGVGIFAIVTVVVGFATYPTAERFIARLLLLYLSLMLIYTNFYFLMMVFFSPHQSFEGIHSPWTWLEGYEWGASVSQ